MNTGIPDGTGWLDLLRRISGSMAALGRNRFELLTVELQEEKLRLMHALLWLGLAVGVGVAGVGIGLAALALWLWTVMGYAGLIALAVTALALAGFMVWRLRRKILSDPTPFAQTVAEFRKDGECLRNSH